MKNQIYKIICLLVLISSLQLASVNTRLSFVSNSYDTPSPGIGTIIMDVEAVSDAGNVSINVFQDAFQLDAAFQSQNPDVTFSQHLFPSQDYNTTEDYRGTDGRVRYTYTFNSGTRGVIGDSWTKVVRVTVQYTMTDANGNVTWFNGIPNYTVTNEYNDELKDSEETIPPELQNMPLPVELMSFSAEVGSNNKVTLSWETATEVNNYGFEIERQMSEVNNQNSEWKKIGFVEGHGNSNSQKFYEFIDTEVTSGKYNYRLKQIDIDGTFEYSEIVEVDLGLPSQFSLSQNYPNPFNPTTKIKYQLPKAAEVSLKVFDVLGNEIANLVNKKQPAGFYEVEFDASDLSSGVYLYKIISGHYVDVKKMIVLR